MASRSGRCAISVEDDDFDSWARGILDESECSDDEDEEVMSAHDSASEQEASDDDVFRDPAIVHPIMSPSSFPYLSPSTTPPPPSGQDESTSSDDEPLAEVARRQTNYFLGKNRFTWAKKPPGRTRTRQHNIISHLPGRIGPAKDLGLYCTHQSAWGLFFDEEILKEVLLRTNEKLALIREKLSDKDRTDFREIVMEEFRAFLGILILTAIFKSNHEDLESLFSTDGMGRDIFRCTMSLKRVRTILLCLRFDNAADRQERKSEDKTAAISWVFQKFLQNCKSSYSIGENACIDEMLVGFRGKCSFRMYIPSKPRKYGLKIMAMTDAKTHYLISAYIYSGKDSDGSTLTDEERKLPKPTQSVLRLAAPIMGTNRNITADSWFTSIPLVLDLKKKGLTYVGTLRKNKREIPKEFLPSRNRDEGSTIHGFTKDLTLVSYVPKKGRAVILVSSMHHTPLIDEETKKPEIIIFYNDTKGGVDALDEKCTVYSTSRKTCRWPLAIFFTLINISLVNAYVVFSSCPGNQEQKRMVFIKMLARQLIEPHLNSRFLNSRLPRELRLNIGRILEKPLPCEARQDLDKQRRCSKCPRKSDKKTKFTCYLCRQPICIGCALLRCRDCSGE